MRPINRARAAGAGVGLLASLVTLGLLQTSPADAPQRPAQEIPPGYDFPAEAVTLRKAIDDEDVLGMRRHAWLVFAGLTQPTKEGKPIWTTWHYRDEVFRDQAPGAPPKKFEKAAQLELGHVLEVRDSLPSIDLAHQIPTVNLYNEDAFGHIRKNNYHAKATLQGLIKPDGRAGILPFPNKAVILKTIWWPVKKDDLTPLPVWDQEPLKKPEEGNGYTTFKRVVAIDPKRKTIPEGETTDAVQFNDPKNPDKIIPRPGSRVVPLEQFFHFALTGQDAQDLNQVVKDFIKKWYGREVREGDHAVLLGFHMTTREIPEWVWATFWWHDRPEAGDFSKDRPDKVTGVWRNYLMAVSYSMVTPKETDGSAHVAFNPYLEAPLANGTLSNCMTCHRRAVWPTKKIANDNPLVNPFTVTRGALSTDPPMFKNRVTTDFLWSLPLHSK
jgi:hypothetical protein